MIETVVFAGDSLYNKIISNQNRKYPSYKDIRFNQYYLKQNIIPKFKLLKPLKVFTIGSCFARNIELALKDISGIYLPTLSFKVPKNEWPAQEEGVIWRGNDILSEYTPTRLHKSKNNEFHR